MGLRVEGMVSKIVVKSKQEGYAQKSKTKFEILGEISLNIYLEIKTFKKLFSILCYMMNTNLLVL